jgi:hypothetical protein
MKIELSPETADALLVDILRHTYSGILHDYNILARMSNLTPYEQEDMAYNLALLDPILRVLEHFSVSTDHIDWLNNQPPRA